MSNDAEELLIDIGEAVAAMDGRLAGVEAAVVHALGGDQAGTGREASRWRRPLRSSGAGVPSSAALRRARQRRGDAGGIIWTVWALDELTVEQRVDAFVQLREFVDFLNREYQLPLSTLAITPCWYHHPGVVRELWALLASYQHAYSTRNARDVSFPTDAPVLWHERALWPCLRRLREEHGLRECVAVKRHTPQVQTAVSTDDGFAGAVSTLAAEWNRADGTYEPTNRTDVAEPAGGGLAGYAG